MWRLRYDEPENILHIHVAGFWTPAMVAQFAPELYAAKTAALRVRPDIDALVESLDFPVQSLEVSELLAAAMWGSMAVGRIRSAVVVGSAINRLQAERTLTHPAIRIFMTIAEARAWLRTPRMD